MSTSRSESANLFSQLAGNARQPTLVNAKISEVLPQTRDDLLEICSKSLEYFVMSQTTQSISGLGWGNDIFFQVASCKYFDITSRAIRFSERAKLTDLVVYLVLEAHQRYNNPQVVDLWSLIGRGVQCSSGPDDCRESPGGDLHRTYHSHSVAEI